MEKESVFLGQGNALPPAWNSPGFENEVANPYQHQQLPNWGNAMDQSDPFESALTSISSSPAAGGCGGDGSNSIVLRELIGRLGGGTISSPGEISSRSYPGPGGILSKINLSGHPSLASFSTNPGFAERAAKFSCFGMNSQAALNELELHHRLLTPGTDMCMLSRVSSNQSIKVAGTPFPAGIPSTDEKFIAENAENGDSQEGSSVSEQIPVMAQIDANSRKRKSVATKGKQNDGGVKVEAENEESNAKRSKTGETNGTEKDAAKSNAEGNRNRKQTKENPKVPEPPKDYIHVRARRGQATDSHSLAERVRREKINERMKFLQDLVPGCNKMTGRAVMLDEIINYVQSLQRQVEFLSMKLATVNPRMDLNNMEALLSKDIFQSRGSLPLNAFPADNWQQAFLPPYSFPSQHGASLHSPIHCRIDNPFPNNPLSSAVHQKPSSIQLPPIDGASEADSQVSMFWEGDLQSVVQMGLGQSQQQSSHAHGPVITAKMKVER